MLPRLAMAGKMIITKARAAEDRRRVLSESERGLFRSRVLSTSQDLVPSRSGMLTLSNAQSVSTHDPHFYRYERVSGNAFQGPTLPELNWTIRETRI